MQSPNTMDAANMQEQMLNGQANVYFGELYRDICAILCICSMLHIPT